MLTGREQVNRVRVVTVTKDGKDVAFSSLGDKLERLPPDGFVAIDTEFSGLGESPNLRHSNLQTRYKAQRQLANTRAIFSVGVSIFSPVQNTQPQAYEVATYDLLTSCQDTFDMAPNSGEFLVAHGFDFNQMFKKGIPYIRASTEKQDEKEGNGDVGMSADLQWRWGKLPRGLLWRIGRHGVPIIVHNGLFDLMFLYAAFQAPLPETLNGFVGALTDCVPAGFWDSKVLATETSEGATFLSYLFAKSVLQNSINVATASGLPSNTLTDPDDVPTLPSPDILCALYAFRGYCPRGTECMFSHDAFQVVNEEQKGHIAKDSREAHKRHKAQSKTWKKQKHSMKAETSKLSKKQRKKHELQRSLALANEVTANQNGTSAPTTPSPPDQADDTSEQKDGMDVVKPTEETDDSCRNVHTAGWDAFCTGYIFAAFRATLPAEKLEKQHNYIALSGKMSNLLLRRSEYADLDEICDEVAKNLVEQPVATDQPASLNGSQVEAN